MDPVAFQLGPLSIRWYGICFALGFVAAYLLFLRRARGTAVGSDGAADLALAAMVGGLIGARGLYVAQNWTAAFRGRLHEIIRIDHGGLVFYGGFLAAAALLLLLSWRRGYRYGLVADLIAPCLALGHAFGRVGCLLNGCCFGRPWSGPLAMTYPAPSEVLAVQYAHGLFRGGEAEQVRRALEGLPTDAAVACLPVLPVQAGEALLNLALAVLLLRLARRLQGSGRLFALYLMLYGGGRFALEFLRGDYLERLGPFTPAQVICLGLVPAGALLWHLTRGADGISGAAA
jgi:phosphatidylglycerol:prolipoprotein diacylglycerol transferase